MQFNLYINEKCVGTGVLSVSREGVAHFFENLGNRDDRILAELTRTKLDFVGANGLCLTGFRPTGKFDKSGLQKYVMCEWWLCYKK